MADTDNTAVTLLNEVPEDSRIFHCIVAKVGNQETGTRAVTPTNF